MTKVPCAIPDCDRPFFARGWCASHYKRWHHSGDPLPKSPRPKETCSVGGCQEPSRTRGWCISHYQRWHRTGDPLPPTPLDRYWAQVDTSGGPNACWPWTGSRDKKGYGIFSIGGKHPSATRWGYSHRIGPIPRGHGILHHCDNPPCQNDRHWFTGTRADNNADKMRKGRQRNIRGVDCHSAKLTEAQVREIRRIYASGGVSQKLLAADYGINQVTVGCIVRRETWKHVA